MGRDFYLKMPVKFANDGKVHEEQFKALIDNFPQDDDKALVRIIPTDAKFQRFGQYILI
ncbi:MAG: hypothetical protein GY865_12280 [candidate division Zixibacteria bacterium]|nr:hypothetical protein [candidate division Zixibacteria bacterium]